MKPLFRSKQTPFDVIIKESNSNISVYRVYADDRLQARSIAKHACTGEVIGLVSKGGDD